jgi:hypothetical protein
MYKIKAERIPGSRPKRFNPDGWLHYHVRIYLEADTTTPLTDVEMVVYILDPSFENRYVVSVDRSRMFEIRIWTYGFFAASAKVLRTDGTHQTVTGEVRWEGRVEEEEYA